MSWHPLSASYTCVRCLRAQTIAATLRRHAIARQLASSPLQRNSADATKHDGPEQTEEKPEKGALSRRLEQMSEEALESGGSSARKAVKEAGFSDDLRKQLEERIAQASFRSEHANAFAQASLPPGAGRGTRDIAGALAWTGTESVEDTALRMLTDAHKPLKTKPRSAVMARPPKRIDTGRPGKAAAAQQGEKLANARDKSSYYALAKDGSMSEDEREKFRKEMRARFRSEARAAPATINGLQELANQRIEDAIARGQFKNIPRGMKVERDYNASSPFIDTTEYFMNKIIQKQEIVPPWIEKQQELVSAATKFRSRLRNDWRRHAARTIASYGGDLQTQVRRAEEFAAAEMIANPPKQKKEVLNAVDDRGHLSQITLAGELQTAKDPTAGEHEITEEDIKIIETIVEPAGDGPPPPPEPASVIDIRVQQQTGQAVKPAANPFRDPAWLAVEQSYFDHTIKHLNSLNRSYNLIAPELAKKPYFTLERELESMYRDVAPTLANEIKERARAPRVKVTTSAAQGGEGVLGAISARDKAKVWDEDQGKHYGFKEFWKDLFMKT